MDTKTIVMCVVALILGMLMANMLKSVCGCNSVEGFNLSDCNDCVQDRFLDPKTHTFNAGLQPTTDDLTTSCPSCDAHTADILLGNHLNLPKH